MFSRTISLVLIAAIIACPMWCGSGLCIAGQCCEQAASSASDAGGDHRTMECCRKCDGHNDSDQNRPCLPETSCQGVCGGAVLQKSVELDDFSDTFFRPMFDDHAPITARLLECSHGRSEQHRCGSNTNHGRFVRTLHMSFLC
jgi:hypothetical protein